MRTDDFIKKVVNPRLKVCVSLMEGEKDAEYSRNGDKFHNFKETARLRDIGVFDAWDGMMNKHLTSVLDLVKDAKCGVYIDPSVLSAKITDLINYLLLFEGLVVEKQLSEDKKKK